MRRCALAQIAAFGATIAILVPWSGGDPHSPAVYWVSLAFTFIGAAIFSTIRSRHARIPQEAIIGISYAVASAATILALSKSSAESEHLKDMLVGNILAVSWPKWARPPSSMRVIGMFHFIFRKKFLAISMDHDGAEAHGHLVRLWDFLFYASFGFVVTRSVAIAGVLLVFCYLIVPSVAAMLFCRSHRSAPGDRLDDGHDRLGARGLPVAEVRFADRRDYRLHVWLRADPDGGDRVLVPRRCRPGSGTQDARAASGEVPRNL